jgi:hypothetical protein
VIKKPDRTKKRVTPVWPILEKLKKKISVSVSIFS